ncbi:MAG TPA: iron-sulfur cluster assembly protein [Candidatus Eremiobacteraceae bacterium]|nr:iron-sulfur cluster assembly protein [Candidatus Eremiobacteraceae bacterium]
MDIVDGGTRPSTEPELTPERIREALKSVVDPEIGLDVINLGLIYDIAIDGSKVAVLMTLTTPGCPVAGMFLASVKSAIEAIPGVTECTVDLTFTPPWDPRAHCSEEAKMMLGLYY